MKKLLILFILFFSSTVYAFNPFVVFSGVPASSSVTWLLDEDFSGTTQPAGWTDTENGTATIDWSTSGYVELLASASDLCRTGFQLSTSYTALYIAVEIEFSALGTIENSFLQTNELVGGVGKAQLTSTNNYYKTRQGSSSDISSTAPSTSTRYYMWIDSISVDGGNDGVLRIYVSSTKTKPGAPVAEVTNGNETDTDQQVIVLQAINSYGFRVYHLWIDDEVIGNLP